LIKLAARKFKSRDLLNLLTNIPVKIANQKVVSKQVKNSLGVAYQTNISTKVGAVYEISISR